MNSIIYSDNPINIDLLNSPLLSPVSTSFQIKREDSA